MATAAASIAVTALAMTALSALRPEPTWTPGIFEIGLDGLEGADRDIEISPDGTAFATASGFEGDRTLLVRRLDEADFRPVGGGTDPIYPSFSPDGDWLVYVETGEGNLRKLMRVAVAGGSALTLVAIDSIGPFDPHWGEDGTIVFVAQGSGAGTYRVPSVGGGAPERISALPGRNPFMLPDGSGALVSAVNGGIHVVDLRADSFPSREIIPEGADPSYVETGHVLYTLPGGGLFAAPFDLGTHQVTGPSAPVAGRRALRGALEGVLRVSRWHARRHAGSQQGAVSDIIIVPPVRRLGPGPVPPGRLPGIRSGGFTRRDVRGVRVERSFRTRRLRAGFPEPLGQWRVSSSGGAREPRWAPDGGALYYWAQGADPRRGPNTLFEVAVRSEPTPTFGAPQQLFSGPYSLTSWDVRPDGRFLLTEWADAEGVLSRTVRSACAGSSSSTGSSSSVS